MAVEAALVQRTVFQDNERMTQLDVTFANRYLTALNGYFHPDLFPGVSGCWLASFVGAETAGDTVVQHMLSGVAAPVSYTHLDVYKRQIPSSSRSTAGR